MGQLEGKVALITGASKGIGRVMSRLFAQEGAAVICAARTRDLVEETAGLIKTAGGRAIAVTGDAATEGDVQRMIEAGVRAFGKLDVLINNAAPTDAVSTSVKPLTEYTTDEWDRIIVGTLTGNVFWSCKYGIPHLAAAGGGSIVNISSGQSVIGMSGFSAYSAAKGAINSLTRSLAVETADQGIRVNTIIVGRVIAHKKDTGVAAGPGHLTRLGEPNDIAYAATWLASDEAAFVTGSLITADGGFTINGNAIAGLG